MPLDKLTHERVIEILLEAARRANWDAQRGPKHLRTGRYLTSPIPAAQLMPAKTRVRM